VSRVGAAGAEDPIDIVFSRMHARTVAGDSAGAPVLKKIRPRT